MGLISEYFVKFEKIGFNEKRIKNILIQSIISSVGINKEDFKVETKGNNKFLIKCRPSIRNLIVINKIKISKSIKKMLDTEISFY
jgi:hypothetical protein